MKLKKGKGPKKLNLKGFEDVYMFGDFTLTLLQATTSDLNS